MNRKPERRIKGVIHFHSNYSYDGRDNIRDIVAFLKTRGCSFVFLTEHDDDFNEEKMKRFVEECQEVSSEEFLVVPGIEFRCQNKVHILGLGLTHFVKEDNPERATMWIKDNGGKAVIAHPIGYCRNISDCLLASVDGIEIWNGHKDGKWCPDHRVLTKFKTWRELNPALVPIVGGDHHSIEKYFPIEIVVDGSKLKFAAIWQELCTPQKICGKYISFRGMKDIYQKRFLLKSIQSIRKIVISIRNE